MYTNIYIYSESLTKSTKAFNCVYKKSKYILKIKQKNTKIEHKKLNVKKLKHMLKLKYMQLI